MLRSKLPKLEFRSTKRQMTFGQFGPCSLFRSFFRALTGNLCDTLRELNENWEQSLTGHWRQHRYSLQELYGASESKIPRIPDF